MSVTASYLPSGEVEYIGDCDHGTLWFNLDPKTGKAKFFDENGKPMEKPSFMNGVNLYKLVFGENETRGLFSITAGE
jgi:antitoxin component YwqK of YwqJK toxin-antitoxin module